MTLSVQHDISQMFIKALSYLKKFDMEIKLIFILKTNELCLNFKEAIISSSWNLKQFTGYLSTKNARKIAVVTRSKGAKKSKLNIVYPTRGNVKL